MLNTMINDQNLLNAIGVYYFSILGHLQRSEKHNFYAFVDMSISLHFYAKKNLRMNRRF